MAKDTDSKPASKPAITSHPLFPAIVALWFGALFGLGSLAIRPSLLDSIVAALKIDAVIASAAPPLGATARILLALAMTGIGGLIGATLARRLTRPKKVVVARRRGAGPAARADTRPSAPVAAQEPASEAETPIPEKPANALARRSLLANREESGAPDAYAERAPVPGSAPQILNVAEFDLEGFDADIVGAAAHDAGPEISFAPAAEVADPLAPPAGAQVFGPEPTVPEPEADTDERQPEMPFSVPVDDGEKLAIPAPASEVEAEPAAVAAPFAPPVVQADADGEERDADLPRLGPDAIDAPAPDKPRTIFDTEAAPGLFTRPLNARVAHVGWPNGLTGEGKVEESPLTTPVDAPAPVLQPDQASIAPDEQESAPLPEPISESAAQRIASTKLDDLSHVELLERLAISMRRRNEASAARVPDAPVATSTSEVPATAAPAVASQQDGNAPAAEPLAEPAKAEPASAETGAQAPFAPPVPFIPEALRPVGLTLDDDDDRGHAHVPPRHFAALSAASGDGQADSDGDDDLEASGYSSLLELSRPAAAPQRFVRIEEPTEPSAEPEPVVVFPGQENRTVAPFSKPDSVAPEAVPAAESQAPSAPDQPPPFAPPAAGKDPAETERALRGALSTLQRMGGAA